MKRILQQAVKRYFHGKNLSNIARPLLWGKIGHGFKPEGNMRKDEYIRVSIGHGKRVLKHRLLMEHQLGRKLLSHEIVHHKDENNKNNDISNLIIITQSQHIEKHREQLLAARGILR